ncbi:translin-like [Eriocheir sinensis]|uniref:translin-like n=1 Tax=Eriocheir sinensis TaxID=95602 RepID=UPI0021C6FE92|nr:translin-like [Eriocheir sinensis]XP_050693008.1 translin-like [Eriocheir sinensis]XP_050693009.1 translin-like [Eriocheir sinensis]XP_050693010.1 translin-like [Eriocheir sinensis]
MDIAAAFSTYGSCVEREAELREGVQAAVKDLEKTSYAISTILEKIHNAQGIQNIEAICAECHQELTKIPALYQALQEKVPPGEFYRYHHNFRGTTHRLVAATCFITYLEENRLPMHEEVAKALGLCTHRDQGFHLDLEDYLQGTLSISHELSRLAINSVTAGDYARPFHIRQFLRDLHAAYSLLFPKNELRKKFDELKYSLKKTEEVVYNLSLRGLKPPEMETSG